jgi:hypothetical protein
MASQLREKFMEMVAERKMIIKLGNIFVHFLERVSLMGTIFDHLFMHKWRVNS